MNYSGVILNVDGKEVVSTRITYQDLCRLYEQFVEKNGRVPISSECTVKNNLPQTRIVNRILREQGVTYKDFVGLFGKRSHARANHRDYDIFLNKFKLYSQELGRALTSDELVSEKYNLPSVKWFITYCPDKSVKTYSDFIRWCGFEPTKKVWTKDEVAAALVNYEKRTGRNITVSQINTDNVGFSMIVVNRLFGSLGNARDEIGLLPVVPRNVKSPQHYIDVLTDVVLDYRDTTGSPYITWRQIESGNYGKQTYNHKCYTQNFNRAGVDIFAHVKSLGCTMNPTGFSSSNILDDGELVRSEMEFEFTSYLRSCGLQYQIDYDRDVRYKTFSSTTRKIDCDYVLHINNSLIYIEIAGVLCRPRTENWFEYEFCDEKQNTYRDNLLEKMRILESMGLEYYFIFKNDMSSGAYKELVDRLLKRRAMVA